VSYFVSERPNEEAMLNSTRPAWSWADDNASRSWTRTVHGKR
jgi:hypothetical protein